MVPARTPGVGNLEVIYALATIRDEKLLYSVVRLRCTFSPRTSSIHAGWLTSREINLVNALTRRSIAP